MSELPSMREEEEDDDADADSPNEGEEDEEVCLPRAQLKTSEDGSCRPCRPHAGR